MDPAESQPHYNQGSCDEDLVHYILEKLIEQPNHSYYCLCSFVTSTDARVCFSAVLSRVESAMSNGSQHVLCSNSNSNSNEIPTITKFTSIQNMGFFYGCMIVERVRLLGG